MQLAKTHRWRKERTPTTSTPNKFGAVAVQMVYSLLSFLSQTRSDEVIWGGFKVVGVDDRGKVKLSRKAAMKELEGQGQPAPAADAPVA